MHDIAQLRAEIDDLRREIDTLRRTRNTSVVWRWATGLGVAVVCLVAAPDLSTPIAATPTKVSAPFAVVNDAGEVIFLVHQMATGPSVEVHTGGKRLLQMGMGDHGNPAFRVTNSSGAAAVALGAAAQGGFGGLHIFNGSAPEPVAWVVGSSPHGAMMAVSGGNTIPHAALTLGANGGVVQLADTKGGIKAEGGTLPSGAGVFRVKGQVFAYIAGEKMRLPAW